MNMRVKEDIISTSDANAKFIADNDMSNNNACVDSIKIANAALKSKVEEMEKTLDVHQFRLQRTWLESSAERQYCERQAYMFNNFIKHT